MFSCQKRALTGGRGIAGPVFSRLVDPKAGRCYSSMLDKRMDLKERRSLAQLSRQTVRFTWSQPSFGAPRAPLFRRTARPNRPLSFRGDFLPSKPEQKTQLNTHRNCPRRRQPIAARKRSARTSRTRAQRSTKRWPNHEILLRRSASVPTTRCSTLDSVGPRTNCRTLLCKPPSQERSGGAVVRALSHDRLSRSAMHRSATHRGRRKTSPILT